MDEAVTAYLEEFEAGRAPSREEWLARYPDLAEPLSAFFAGTDLVRNWTRPLCQAVQGFSPGKPGAVRFGDYELLAEIGRGGKGVVYEARQVSLNRTVALKMVRIDQLGDEMERRRLRKEAEMTALLDHPRVVTIHDVGECDGQMYFSMKRFPGGSLDGRLDSFTAQPRQAAELVAQVARAVHHAHERGILHRDLKPSNILLDAAGAPYVADFGLARRLDSDSELTKTGDIVGTPNYMAPEQTTGDRRLVTTAADVYGLGGILYALLTGAPPFASNSLFETLAQVREQPPASPDRRNPRVGRDLATICLTCLRKVPSQRYATAESLALDLEAYLHGLPIQARPIGPWERAWKWARRRPGTAGLMASILVLTVTVVVGLSVGLWVVDRERQRTEQALTRALTAEDATLRDYGESTDEVIEQLIGSRPVLGEQEKAYLKRTLKRWQTFADRIGDDERSQQTRAEGQMRVAFLRSKLGQIQEALAGYQVALAIWQKLADDFPAVAAYRQGAARSYNSAGGLLAGRNEADRATEQFREALAIQQKLADDFPGVAEYRQDLANSHNNLGLLLANRNQADRAAEQYRKVLDIQQKLADDFPDVPGYLLELARSHNNLGTLLAGRGQTDRAVEQHRRALNIRRKLADKFPSVPGYRMDLAGSHNNLGVLLSRQNQADRAAGHYRKALDIQQKLADDFPSVPAYRQDLALSHSNLGLLLGGQNQFDRAAEHYRKALDIQQKLADGFPAVPAYCVELSRTLFNLGLVLASQNQPDRAAEQYGKALVIQQKLAGDFPAIPDYRQDLAKSHNNLGFLLAGWNQAGKAAEQYRKALVILQKLTDDFPELPAYRQELARSQHNLGQVLASQNQINKAAEQYLKALDIQQKLANDFPGVPAYRQELAGSRHSLGILLADQNQLDKAAEQYRKALDILEKLADDFPDVAAYRVGLGASCCGYANVLRDGGKPSESLPWYKKAITTLTALYERDPNAVLPRHLLRTCHQNRALTHDRLMAHARAVKDWNRAIDLSPPGEQATYRPRLANSLIRAGIVSEAVAEVAELTKSAAWAAEQWYDFACIYALASGKSADKKRQYADRAMELLRTAVKAGYKNAAQMAKDTDLDVLHGRDDFRKLMMGLGKTKE
jgi:tetratricopeptide (TPR) repeat protein/tRNA A-37 threonylcarbamoyl transferase component Bud32